MPWVKDAHAFVSLAAQTRSRLVLGRSFILNGPFRLFAFHDEPSWFLQWPDMASADACKAVCDPGFVFVQPSQTPDPAYIVGSILA